MLKLSLFEGEQKRTVLCVSLYMQMSSCTRHRGRSYNSSGSFTPLSHTHTHTHTHTFSLLCSNRVRQRWRDSRSDNM